LVPFPRPGSGDNVKDGWKVSTGFFFLRRNMCYMGQPHAYRWPEAYVTTPCYFTPMYV
jgi:hypothetical protein